MRNCAGVVHLDKGGEKMRIGKRGQSVLEYVIVLTVIIAAVIGVAATAIKPAVEGSVNKAGTSITTATTRLP
jgi:hypothetical protein